MFWCTVRSEDTMKEYNSKAHMDSYFRIKELDKSMELIKDTVLGRRESFLSYVTGEDEKLDSKKVDAFIDELISGFMDYYNRDSMTDKDIPDETALDFYRDVLYCAVVAPLASPGYAYDVDYSVRKSFKDILSAVSDKGFVMQDKKTFIENEESDRLEEYCSMEFIYSLNDAYLYLTGKRIRDSYTAEEKSYANEVYYDIVGSEYEDPEEYGQEVNSPAPDSQEAGTTDKDNNTDTDDAGTAAQESEIDGKKIGMNIKVITKDDPEYSLYDEDDQEQSESEDEMEELPEFDPDDYYRQMEMEEQYLRMQMELCEESRQRWKAHIGSCDLLPETYMRVRNGLFTVNMKNMVEDITEMVDIFLYRHELSAVSFGKAYGLIAHRVDETVGYLESEIKRARLLV